MSQHKFTSDRSDMAHQIKTANQPESCMSGWEVDQHVPATAQKARGAGQPPRTYTAAEWIKGYAAWLLVLPLYAALWAFARVFKRVPGWLLTKLIREHRHTTAYRGQDVRIPADTAIPAYMRRWWKIPRNAFFNIYYHIVMRSDDDRALHDHPWWNFSIVLEGGYFEHKILEGGVTTKRWYGPGSVLFRRSGDYAHRLELDWEQTFDQATQTGDGREIPARSIFITGPTLRRWGFHHPLGWVDAYDWDDFMRKQGAVNTMPMSGYMQQGPAQ